MSIDRVCKSCGQRIALLPVHQFEMVLVSGKRRGDNVLLRLMEDGSTQEFDNETGHWRKYLASNVVGREFAKFILDIEGQTRPPKKKRG